MGVARSKLIRHPLRRCSVIAHCRPSLLLLVNHQQVAEQGFRSDMVPRACNYPHITDPVLSHEQIEARLSRLLRKRKADVAWGLVSFARGNGGTKEAGEGVRAIKRQWCNGGTANEVLPISKAQESHEKPEREVSLLRERVRTGDAGRGEPTRRNRAHSSKASRQGGQCHQTGSRSS